VATESVGSQGAANPDFADPAAPTTATIAPAKPLETVSDAPSVAPPVAAASNRPTAEISPPSAAEISNPPVDTSPIESRPLESPTPLPAALQSRQPVDSAITTAPQAGEPSASLPSAPDESRYALPTTVNRADDIPNLKPSVRHAESDPKSLAKPEIAKPADAVVAPVFPSVTDDPFAPLVAPPAPATVTPRNVEPQDDDPFAPLKPAPAPEARPSAPIAAEPTMKLIDPLSPAADGRLPLREWSDNSGQFRVQARLVLILEGNVRLLKATGRTTTVPTERLSAADHAYVDEVVARYGKDLAKLDQLAAR
jgi:hypothetical protein